MRHRPDRQVSSAPHLHWTHMASPLAWSGDSCGSSIAPPTRHVDIARLPFFGVSQESPMSEATGRLYLCVRCRAQVVICKPCDRGQRFCTRECARATRRECVLEAGRRYQDTRRGRTAHARRQARYRDRRQKVTHHGSPAAPANDVLQSSSNDVAIAAENVVESAATSRAFQCARCGRALSPFVRRDFVRRRGRNVRSLGYGDTS